MSNGSVAVVQMVSTFDVEHNLKRAEALVAAAAEQGANCVALPENFAVLDSDNLYRWGEEERQTGLFSTFLGDLCRHHGIWIVGGTIPMRTDPKGRTVDGQRVNAASILFDPTGAPVARYDKIHLFDVTVADAQKDYRESRYIAPGDQLTTAETPFGRLGLSVCYDLRFPELYRALANKGCEWFTVPSAFTYQTGRDHWAILVRARAIENQGYVIAPNQGGQHSKTRVTWGHSMIVDPWGRVLAEVEEPGEGFAIADIPSDRTASIRQQMPMQQQKRFDQQLHLKANEADQ